MKSRVPAVWKMCSSPGAPLPHMTALGGGNCGTVSSDAAAGVNSASDMDGSPIVQQGQAGGRGTRTEGAQLTAGTPAAGGREGEWDGGAVSKHPAGSCEVVRRMVPVWALPPAARPFILGGTGSQASSLK
ncbi:unnamed protein product [Merluccius merluccius]